MHIINVICLGTILCISTMGTPSFAAGDGNFSLNRVKTFMGHKDRMESVTFSPDGSLLATGVDDNLIVLWDSKTWKEVRCLKGHDNIVYTLAFSPEGGKLASGDRGRKIILWETETGKEIRRIKIGDDVNEIVFSPDGKFLAIASNSDEMLLWDISFATKPRKLKGHKDDIKSVAFSRDGKLLASGSKDKSVIVWDVATGKILQQFKGHSDDVNAIAFTSNGKYLASGGNDKKLLLWDLSAGVIKNTFTGNLNSIRTLAFINKGDVLVAGESNHKFSCNIRFWETESGKKLASERSDCPLTNISFSPDDNLVAIVAKKISIMERVTTTNASQIEVDVNGPMEFSGVVQLTGTKADELFTRGKEWFVNTFVSANDVLQSVDKENGILMGKGSFKYEPNTIIAGVALRGLIHFTVKIMVKDGRYKYAFTDFRHTGTPHIITNGWGVRTPYELNYGLLTNSDIAPDGVEYRSNVWNHMREVTTKEAYNMADSLSLQMEKPATGKNDW